MLVHWPKIEVKSDLHIIQNGIGKVALWSNMIQDLKTKEPNTLISVSSPWPDLYEGNPKIHSSIKIGDMHVDYKKYFNNIIFHEPYNSVYLKENIHIVDAWRQQYGLEKGDTCIDLAIQEPDKVYIMEIFQHMRGNPFIIIQLKGGTNPMGPTNPQHHDHMIMERNYEHDYNLISALHEEFKNIWLLIVRTKNDRYSANVDMLPRVARLEDEKLSALFAMTQECLSFVTIDSCIHHFAAQRGNIKRGVVMWGRATQPDMIGHDWNANLLSDHPSKVEIRPERVVEELKEILKKEKPVLNEDNKGQADNIRRNTGVKRRLIQ